MLSAPFVCAAALYCLPFVFPRTGGKLNQNPSFFVFPRVPAVLACLDFCFRASFHSSGTRSGAQHQNCNVRLLPFVLPYLGVLSKRSGHQNPIVFLFNRCSRCLGFCFRVSVQVEREVEHDTRIRRSYRNMRGQHNVDCWQWVGPGSATLGTIGVSLHRFLFHELKSG